MSKKKIKSGRGTISQPGSEPLEFESFSLVAAKRWETPNKYMVSQMVETPFGVPGVVVEIGPPRTYAVEIAGTRHLLDEALLKGLGHFVVRP
jgi:hypothetical protein